MLHKRDRSQVLWLRKSDGKAQWGRGPEGSGRPANRTSLPCRLLVCLWDHNWHKLFSHWWLMLAFPVRCLPAGSQLHKAGKQRAVPRARTTLAGQTSSTSFPPPENLSLAVPPEAVSLSTPDMYWRGTGGF